ncbi:hypothetical protein HanPI659440_Chr16g0658551 [Helianthus annuus]|nr:hypothetical protein HanPI659440_Chr16g0658551 [Helianthus annuus]
MRPKLEKTASPQEENSENTPDPTMISSVDTKYCTRKRSDEAGFVDNAKENMKSFIHASFDEHKTCFKATWHKMTEIFQEEKSAGLEAQNPQAKN